MMYYTYITYKKDDPIKAYIGYTMKPIGEYWGSSKGLKKDISKYGKESFIRINLGTFKYKREAKVWEEFYIKMYKTESKYGGYNIHPLGGGVSMPGAANGMFGKTHSKEARKKISDARKKRDPWNKGKTGPNPKLSETRKRMFEEGSLKIIVYEDTGEKISNKLKDIPKSEEHKEKLRLAWNKAKKEGKRIPWNKGLTTKNKS